MKQKCKHKWVIIKLPRKFICPITTSYEIAPASNKTFRQKFGLPLWFFCDRWGRLDWLFALWWSHSPHSTQHGSSPKICMGSLEVQGTLRKLGAHLDSGGWPRCCHFQLRRHPAVHRNHRAFGSGFEAFAGD